jgi:hypothetical protein
MHAGERWSRQFSAVLPAGHLLDVALDGLLANSSCAEKFSMKQPLLGSPSLGTPGGRDGSDPVGEENANGHGR